MSEHATPAIRGDIVATDTAKVNTKGGAMSATLRKQVRAGLGEVDHLSSASIAFDDGQHAVILAGAAESERSSLHVTRTGKNRFEIRLDTGEGTEIDDLTAAFLNLRIEQFKRGQLDFSEPLDAEGWRRMIAAYGHDEDEASGAQSVAALK